ncbi:DNA internalization-related competence protein ComEC/Rec2 [Aliiglaciecola sp. LCG003]|uniref:DNA internalization-related competence protein ComEC/Rec2 n=1 Tax=Aliiglaciecola sp. LCG003 TaxID=3053655 RepID=UPI002573EC0A|nr:DNA internalization-related competence protein ComEC/Rec2 [Aliiglaciecola sp. LCG003]WJG11281.1 DNA internalization-related competence protein ComEC/Rec2 [Aliiglaciecola sp. LCG003]
MTTSLSAIYWPALPDSLLIPIILIISCFSLKYRYGTVLSGSLFGIVWMASVGYWQLHWQLPAQQIRQIQQLSGSVQSIVTENHNIRFNLRVSHIDKQPVYTGPKVRLSWRAPNFTVKQGQLIHVSVKLKPIHGFANQGGFNYQQWLISGGIVATGYVKDSQTNRLIENSISWRQVLIERLSRFQLPNEGWIAALTFGDRRLFGQQDWQLIQATGIAHLVAISGLHLGIVAAISFLFFAGLLKVCIPVFKLPQHLNYHSIGLIFVALATLGYSYLAGFSLPTLRAWIMLVIVLFLSVSYQYMHAANVLLISIFTFIILDPMSMLSASFWLSFCAIFFITLLFWRWPINQGMSDKPLSFIRLVFNWLKNMLKLQVGLGVLMMPIVASHFSMLSLSAVLINLLAIPAVTFVLVPLCLLIALGLIANLDLVGHILWFTNEVIGLCLTVLHHLADNLIDPIQLAGISAVAWGLFSLGGILCCAPIGAIKRVCSLMLILPLLTSLRVEPNSTWFIHVLDVGQGLSVVIEKQGRAMVYDVGGSYASGFNIADAVLLPFLQHRSLSAIDWLIISHFDNDHAGSLQQVNNGIKVNHFASSRDLCQRGWDFEWQGLNISTLSPPTIDDTSNNDSSCVIRIANQASSVLLPGDISQNIELKLIRMTDKPIASDVLIAAHHGSDTSSSSQFVNAVRPQHVVFSQGHLNRWGFPKQAVVNRFSAINATMYSTAESGQITFVMPTSREQAIQALGYRSDIHPVWYNRYLWPQSH